MITRLVSIRMARRCDDTVDKKRGNSCILRHLFVEGVQQPNNRSKPWKSSLRRVTNVTISKFRGWQCKKQQRIVIFRPKTQILRSRFLHWSTSHFRTTHMMDIYNSVLVCGYSVTHVRAITSTYVHIDSNETQKSERCDGCVPVVSLSVRMYVWTCMHVRVFVFVHVCISLLNSEHGSYSASNCKPLQDIVTLPLLATCKEAPPHQEEDSHKKRYLRSCRVLSQSWDSFGRKTVAQDKQKASALGWERRNDWLKTCRMCTQSAASWWR